MNQISDIFDIPTIKMAKFQFGGSSVKLGKYLGNGYFIWNIKHQFFQIPRHIEVVITICHFNHITLSNKIGFL